MLTGGRAAKNIYQKMAQSEDLIRKITRADLYQTDERCVNPLHNESNFSMIVSSLLSNQHPSDYAFYRMKAESSDLYEASMIYSESIPDSLDVLLLSMGEDGHIASLFPNSPALFETERKVLPVVGSKWPIKRLTITPPVIKAAKHVYVLAIGDEKRRKYEEALVEPEDISSLPARLVLDRTWIFDLNEEIDLCPKR